MVAPGLSLSVTRKSFGAVCDGGVKVTGCPGPASSGETVYDAVAIADPVQLDAKAAAFRVVASVIWMGPEYAGLACVGFVPSVV
jgi:hypothetical protein